MSTEHREPPRAPSLIKVLGSVVAGMFGVQSTRKREEDFTHGKAYHYILVGLLVTVIFVLSIWGVVKLVTHLAGV